MAEEEEEEERSGESGGGERFDVTEDVKETISLSLFILRPQRFLFCGRGSARKARPRRGAARKGHYCLGEEEVGEVEEVIPKLLLSYSELSVWERRRPS